MEEKRPFWLDMDAGDAVQFLDQRYRVKAAGAQTGGLFGLVEVSTPLGSGPPPHVHEREDEAFYVLEGGYEVTVGDDRLDAREGPSSSLLDGFPTATWSERRRPDTSGSSSRADGRRSSTMWSGRRAARLRLRRWSRSWRRSAASRCSARRPLGERRRAVEFFFYCRGRPGSDALVEGLAEAHWSFMDGYAEQMIARGPTLTPDRATWTGSMHIVELPDARAARVFAFAEPFYRAGVYDQVLVRRWRNVLGRTMWDYPAELGDDRRFLVIGRGRPGVAGDRQALAAAQRRWFGEPGHRDGVILGGPLLADDGAGWVGSALLVQLGDRAAVEAMVADAPYARAGLYTSVEIHDWQFGGRHQD